MENFDKHNFKPDNQEEKESREERIQEINNFVDEYFRKHKVGYEASGLGSTQGTDVGAAFWKQVKKYRESGLSKESGENLYTLLEEKLKDKDLVDLGVGNEWQNIPNGLSIPLSKYIAVDIKLPHESDIYIHKDRFKEEDIESEFVEGDMLKFVARLPDNSSNFFLGAIDDDVILDEKYWQYLCEEIYRATEEKGVVIDGGVGSIKRYLDQFKEDKFKLIFGEDKPGSKKVMEKSD